MRVWGWPGGWDIPDVWAGLQDFGLLPLAPVLDAWYPLREHVRYRQGELPGDSLRALQSSLKQRYLDVWGSARWTRDHPGGSAHRVSAVKVSIVERDLFQAP